MSDADDELEGTIIAAFTFSMVPEALIYATDVSDRAVRLYAALLRHADSDKRAFPGYRRLAKMLGKSRDSVLRAMAELTETGWVTALERFGVDGRRTTNDYIVNADLPYPSSKSATGLPGKSATYPSSKSATALTRASVERKPEERDDAGFDAFWFSYAHKIGKPQARTAWRRALKKSDAETIMAGLEPWAAAWAARAEPEFIPYPSTWLNGERWNDQPPMPRKPANKLSFEEQIALGIARLEADEAARAQA